MVGVEAEEGAVGFAMNTAVNPVNLNKKIKLKEWFVMLVLHGQTEWMMMLDCTLRVITQAPYPEDQAKPAQRVVCIKHLHPVEPG